MFEQRMIGLYIPDHVLLALLFLGQGRIFPAH